MAIEDLDLEFEDEEEEKKGDALDVDVDLTFSASPDSPQGGVIDKARQKPRPKPAPGNPNNNVADINQAKNLKARPQVRPQGQVKPTPSQDYSDDVQELKAEIKALQERMRQIEHQADLKVAVAEAEKNYLIEYVSNAKVLDHQITQMLQRINAKAPTVKGEVQMIKKHINEFVAKSIPKKKE